MTMSSRNQYTVVNMKMTWKQYKNTALSYYGFYLVSKKLLLFFFSVCRAPE